MEIKMCSAMLLQSILVIILAFSSAFDVPFLLPEAISNNQSRSISESVSASEDSSTTESDTLTVTDGIEPHETSKIDLSIFPSTTKVSGFDDDTRHSCLRDCRGSRPMLCYYKFKLEWYTTMSKACFNCPSNSSDCLRPHCVHADGFERAIVTVNRRMPGPSIQVCAGDEIVVDVINDLGSDTASIHWHGLHQKATPYMDGVPYLTQCPIPPGNSFRYHFLADLPGTHYWHSHSGFQRTDGVFGALVVRSPDDPLLDLYDVDDPAHVLVLTDWMEKLGIVKFVNHHHTEHDNKPYNVLVNGVGKDPRQTYEAETGMRPPIYEIVVQKGKRYRIRTLSNSIQNCPIEISADDHPLLVVHSDGHALHPQLVDNFIIYGGERWDFVIEANQQVGSYWLKFRGLLDCDERFKSAYQLVVLRYEGSKGLPSSIEQMTYEATRAEGFQLNKLNAAPGDSTFMTAAELKGRDIYPGIDRTPDYKFWLNFDFMSKDNEWFHDKEHYPFFGVRKAVRLYVPQINEITLKLPESPPLSQPEDVDEHEFCNASNTRNCKEEFCHCSHVLKVELGSLVEIILVDKGVVYWANHPFHLHGHAFAVLGMGRFGENTTLEHVTRQEELSELNRNFDNPPIKDTVTVPDGGYTIIRFIADNPGYWLFHCHIAFHMEVGMGLVFHVGEQKDVPPKPKDFPRCGSWLPKKLPILNKQLSNQIVDQIKLSDKQYSHSKSEEVHLTYNISKNKYNYFGKNGFSRIEILEEVPTSNSNSFKNNIFINYFYLLLFFILFYFL